mmetsp:Transcript_5605/g.9047  ORF Transcript_5605/g.9047 Transcript_5605/m.9047 type:complete len:645 (+) Transcript_5605:57-1991(+)
MLRSITIWLAVVVQLESAAGNTCSKLCSTSPKREECAKFCAECPGSAFNELKQCVNEKSREAKDNSVKKGTEKADAAKTACKDKRGTERANCFGDEAAKLEQVRSDLTKENRTKVLGNLNQFWRKVEESDKEMKKNEMKSNLFDKVKRNASKSAIESAKCDVCSECCEGNATGKVNGVNKSSIRKVCKESCMMRAILDEEASNLKACYENATTPENKTECFCASRDDDDVRRKLSSAGEANKVKGAMEFICTQYNDCIESDEVDCGDKLRDFLSKAKSKCTSGKQMLKLSFDQLKDKCEETHVEKVTKECKKSLGTNGIRAEVRDCVKGALPLTKGKIAKMELQNAKKQFGQEMATCMTCDADENDDCPDKADCKQIVINSMLEEFNSSCEGNFKALVEDGLESAEQVVAGNDEIVNIPKKGCEVIIRFMKGKGECRADGKVRPELKKELGKKGSMIEGVNGLADTETRQIETQDDGGIEQSAIMVFTLDDGLEPEPAPSSAEGNSTEIAAKCEALVAALLSGPATARRLAQLESSDITDATGTQATQTCLASNTTCQEATLTTDPTSVDDGSTTSEDSSSTSAAIGDGSSTSSTAAAGDGDGTTTTTTTPSGVQSTVDSASSITLSVLVMSVAISFLVLSASV